MISIDLSGKSIHYACRLLQIQRGPRFTSASIGPVQVAAVWAFVFELPSVAAPDDVLANSSYPILIITGLDLSWAVDAKHKRIGVADPDPLSNLYLRLIHVKTSLVLRSSKICDQSTM